MDHIEVDLPIKFECTDRRLLLPTVVPPVEFRCREIVDALSPRVELDALDMHP
jgi:hypothetical protein